MSAKDQIKQIVDYFKREPQLKDKTDGMAEGLLLGAQLADDANELSKETDAGFKALQREYTENGNGSQTTAEITVARDGELVLNDRLKRDFGNVNAQLAQIENEKASINYVDAILMDVAKGGPQGPFMSLAALYAYDFPSGKTGTWLVFDTSFGEGAHSFMWDSTNSIWKDLGVYQGTGIANGTVTNPKYAENSITPEKTTFIRHSTNLFNKDKASVGKLISNTGVLTDNPDYVLSEFINVTPNTPIYIYGAPSYAEFDENGQFIKRVTVLDNDNMYTSSNKTYGIRVNFQSSLINMYPFARVNLGGKKPYEPYYLKIENIKNEVSPTEIIGKITSEQTTDLDANATINIGPPFVLPNINTVHHRLELTGVFYINYKDKRYEYPVAASDMTYVDYSPYWNTGGQIPVIYFNTTTGTFNVYGSHQYALVKEDDVFIMSLWKNSDKHELFGVTANFDYTVNGKKPDFKNKQHFFVPDNLVGMVKMPERNYTYADIDTPELLNQKISELSFKYPDYLTHTLIGKDGSNTHDIYKLSMKAKRATDTEDNRTVPKIIFTSGVHGGEKGSVFATYYLIKALCESWQTNELLEYLRFNIDFEVIYLVNPWGFAHLSDNKSWWGRQTINLVDINRNLPFGWRQGVLGDSTYGGTEPLSEIESRYVKDFIDQNTDAIHYFDFHTNGGSGEKWNDLTYFDAPKKPLFDLDLSIAARYQIEKFTREAIKDYGIEPDTDFIGYIYRVGAEGKTFDYAQSVGIPSITPEVWRKFPSESEYYTSDTIKASTEFLGSWIVNVIRQLKN